MKQRRFPYYLASCVSLVTFAVYLAALRNDFVNWDDDANVYDNIHIRSLGAEFFRWAFTDVSMSLWQPVVWISHAVDYFLWGLRPAGYHFTNILLHTINTALVVYLVVRLLELAKEVNARAGISSLLDERAMLIAAGVAGTLFGLHPLHVESAAWVTGRTDLLATLFFLLSVLAYLGYASADEQPAPVRERMPLYRNGRYLLSLFWCILALASKPVAITLPAVLLILDWYPLKRSRASKTAVIVEKLPFVAASLAATALAFWGQAATRNLALSLEAPFFSRILVAAKALVLYLGKMVFPVSLSPFYPYPTDVSFFSFDYFAALLLVFVITAACILSLHRHKVLPAAWAYFLITLLPVLGLVKVRSAFMADRYTYLPSLGPFLVMGLCASWLWMKADVRKGQKFPVKGVLAIAAALLFIGLSSLTLRQIAVWKNGIELWSQVIRQEPVRVPFAYNSRGQAFKASGQPERAMEDFNTAISLDPGYADAYTSRGVLFRESGRLERAMEDFDQAIALDPERAIAYNDRGLALQELGRLGPAIEDFTTAISLDPSFARAYTNRGLAHEQTDRRDRAFEDYSAAIRVNPVFANAYNNRGLMLERAGRLEQALEDLTTAVRLNPSGVEAYNNRGLVYEDLGQLDKAIEDYSKAIALMPDDYLAYSNRGIARAKKGWFDEAVSDHTKAVELRPDFARGYLDRGELYLEKGDARSATKDFLKACNLGDRAACKRYSDASRP
jgi:protein O-mannosyl-transferase